MTSMGEERKLYKVLVEKPAENRGVHWRMGSESILERLAGGRAVDSTGSG